MKDYYIVLKGTGFSPIQGAKDVFGEEFIKAKNDDNARKRAQKMTELSGYKASCCEVHAIFRLMPISIHAKKKLAKNRGGKK
ncbi:MAG: hypothetical protein AMXMBFR44_1450 [Candidatus Campbellbacteria bacterium]